MTTLRVFKLQVRALRALTMADLEKAGVVEKGDVSEYARFANDPIRWVLLAPEDAATKLWTLIGGKC